jgi:Peptidase C13 family
MTSMLPRFAAWLGIIALVLLLGRPAPAAAVKPSAGWQAVLAAGDSAQPVFDNAVDTIARRLAAHGVPTTNIHRLSASNPSRSPAAEPSSGDRLLTRIAGLPARPGQRCLVFITSHGRQDEGVWLAHDREYLEPGELAQALSGGCARVPTVVVVSACYSGAFAAGTMRAPNRIILTAARRDRPSFGCQTDRTYTFFDECLIDALQRSPTWRAAFADTSVCVDRMEQRLGALPSQPQAFFGSGVRDLPVP